VCGTAGGAGLEDRASPSADRALAEVNLPAACICRKTSSSSSAPCFTVCGSVRCVAADAVDCAARTVDPRPVGRRGRHTSRAPRSRATAGSTSTLLLP
jgi:hypothetical protein